MSFSERGTGLPTLESVKIPGELERGRPLSSGLELFS